MHFPKSLVIASRLSRLAIWQANHVRTLLLKLYPLCEVRILGLSTQGDEILDETLSKVGGKGLFVKELEVAMAEGRADLAVHSLKDVPMDLPHGFEIAAILERENPSDAFVSNRFQSLASLPIGAVVGTSSLRRQSLISARYPGLIVRPLRGNLDTRLTKLDNDEYDGIVLAAAGLIRLSLEERIAERLSPHAHIPAPGQGALAIEILSGRAEKSLKSMLAPLNHIDTATAVFAERMVSKVFGGSCEVPLGAYATVHGNSLKLRAMIGTPDGVKSAWVEHEGCVSSPYLVGQRTAELLELQGASRILAECKVSIQGTVNLLNRRRN